MGGGGGEQVEGFVVGGLTHLGEGRGSAAAGRGADPAALRAAASSAASRDRGARTPPPGPRPAPARWAPQRGVQRSRGRRREAGSAPRALLPPPEPARGERRASARRAAAALGGVGRGGAGSGGGETSRPDARGRGGAARLPLLPLRAPGASPRATLPAARRVHRASEGMCGGRGWSCRRHRHRASRS